MDAMLYKLFCVHVSQSSVDITVCTSLPRLLYCPQIRAVNGGFLGTAHLPQDSNDGNITVCFFFGGGPY